MEFISSGSGRLVYAIDDNRVLKLAHNSSGAKDSLEEHALWADTKHPLLCPVIACGPTGGWLVMERALPALDDPAWRKVAEKVHQELGVTDVSKPQNFGVWSGRIVCVDYGLNKRRHALTTGP